MLFPPGSQERPGAEVEFLRKRILNGRRSGIQRLTGPWTERAEDAKAVLPWLAVFSRLGRGTSHQRGGKGLSSSQVGLDKRRRGALGLLESAGEKENTTQGGGEVGPLG